MKTYTLYESKAYLVKVGVGVTEEMLKGFGTFERDVWGNFASTDFKDGKIVGKKLVNGLKTFYAFEEP